MRDTKYILLLGLIALLHFSCKEEEMAPSERLVVQAYLFANEPITEVEITKLSPFGSDGDEVPASDIKVYIENALGVTQLNPTPDRPGYFDNQLIKPRPGFKYKLIVISESDTLMAETRVPLKPLLLRLNKDVLKIDTSAINPNLDSIQATWAAVEDQFWSWVVTPSEVDPLEIETYKVQSIQNPITANRDFISSNSVQFFGKNAFTVYRVNEEYVRLFDENSTNLFIENGNIQNGLGIFTAFHSDALEFDVVRF